MAGLTDITARLAYRNPMLLIDRVLDVQPGARLIAIKAVTASEPWFRLPSPPASAVELPPVLMMESLCQAAGLLAAWDDPRPTVACGDVMLLGSLSDVRLQGSVEPGSVMRHDVRMRRDLGDAYVFSGTSTVDGRIVLEVGQMVMAIRPATLITSRAATALGSTQEEE